MFFLESLWQMLLVGGLEPYLGASQSVLTGTSRGLWIHQIDQEWFNLTISSTQSSDCVSEGQALERAG